MTADQIHPNRQPRPRRRASPYCQPLRDNQFPGKTCLQKGAGLSKLANFGPGEDMVAVGATHLRLLAVTAAACMVVMTVSCSSAVTKPAAPGSNEPPQKPEFTQVTTSMFVDRSAVPTSAAMEFTAPEHK